MSRAPLRLSSREETGSCPMAMPLFGLLGKTYAMIVCGRRKAPEQGFCCTRVARIAKLNQIQRISFAYHGIYREAERSRHSYLFSGGYCYDT
jgi:hypothetical protein